MNSALLHKAFIQPESGQVAYWGMITRDSNRVLGKYRT
jgi:hypothetical protein